MGCSKIWSLVLCVAGLTTSLLTYYVEMKKLENPESEALCDINEDFNCSAVITSPYAVGFGVVEPLLGKDHFLNIPNPLYGIAFYLVIILFSLIQTSPLLAKCQFFLVLLINCGTPILGYIMLYVIQKYCIFCLGIYVINLGLLITSYCKKRALQANASPYYDQGPKRKDEPRLPFDFKKNI
ncbi:vitamin K epoxide reductase complex subunit 1 [Lepeophtheirus salmonis]|uniref:vitamin-K-epoxide reductase (warfarin-sensitive) n=1 Tax=Lepeophtheirus salmonis TaxID=72036 RepID=D3PFX5_LEPSM|nr:vitamin K epoxide reductase complex subunit 1-like [Lepeophtheirus salmonis]ADD24171.1 Vitamin K epoxide reductase complex subunit 1-like protein 1 [Lepeophtheirus salmonis]ADD38934.1 Vitamin K epoxide reductase complex subunit 1-like protein 1 [Lepeophtheirus salmonis]